MAILKKTFTNFIDDNCTQMAAALAYYTIFSIPPLLAIAIPIARYGAKLATAPENGNARSVITREVEQSLGPGAADQIQEAIDRASQLPNSTLGVVGAIVVLLFGASGVMVQLQSSLNQIWKVQTASQSGGIRNFLTKRLLSFAMILGVGFVLLVTMLLSAVLSSFGNTLNSLFPDNWLVQYAIVANILSDLLVAALLFAAILKWIPDAQISWRQVGMGAAATAVLFVLGKSLLAVYFGKFDVGSAYGAAGSLALILVWVYYSGLIFFLGAEFTHALAVQRDGAAPPEPGAERV